MTELPDASGGGAAGAGAAATAAVASTAQAASIGWLLFGLIALAAASRLLVVALPRDARTRRYAAPSAEGGTPDRDELGRHARPAGPRLRSGPDRRIGLPRRADAAQGPAA